MCLLKVECGLVVIVMNSPWLTCRIMLTESLRETNVEGVIEMYRKLMPLGCLATDA